MANLSELAQRVERGESSGLHAEILGALVGVNAPDAKRWYGAGRTPLDSLDEAIAFLERMLPGWLWAVANFGESEIANAYIAAGLHAATVDGFAPSPARALLAAILRALAAKESA